MATPAPAYPASNALQCCLPHGTRIHCDGSVRRALKPGHPSIHNGGRKAILSAQPYITSLSVQFRRPDTINSFFLPDQMFCKPKPRKPTIRSHGHSPIRCISKNLLLFTSCNSYHARMCTCTHT